MEVLRDNPQDLSSHYLTAREASQLTKLSVQTLAKLRVYGGGPIYLKVGRKVLYRVGDVEAWLSTKARNNTSEKA